MDVKFIFDRAEADKMRRDWERVDRSRAKASEIIIIIIKKRNGIQDCLF